MIEQEVYGMAPDNVRGIGGDEHLRSSIVDILTTPKGTRVMRRDYGSDLFDLIDNPLNDETVMNIYASVAEALEIWEPRVDVRQIEVEQVQAGRLVLNIEAVKVADGKAITLRELVV